MQKGRVMAHIPERMCIACRTMFPKHELIKFVLEDEIVIIDKFQKKFGRGAYICKKEECIEKAKKKRALSAKFKMAVPDSIYDEIRGVIDG